MAHTIYKYDLSLDETTSVISMPEGSTILHVAAVNDQACLWAIVDPDRPLVDRGLYIAGTGKPLPTDDLTGWYIGSAILLNGRLVAHVFDRGEIDG